MKQTAYFGNLSQHSFRIGAVSHSILDLIPNKTPIKVYQALYFDEDGNEVFSDLDDLIRNKWQLWLWLHEGHQCMYIEFCIPGDCTWVWNHNQLTVICHHKGTRMFWIKQILNELGLSIPHALMKMNIYTNQHCLLLNEELFKLQLS